MKFKCSWVSGDYYIKENLATQEVRSKPFFLRNISKEAGLLEDTELKNQIGYIFLS